MRLSPKCLHRCGEHLPLPSCQPSSPGRAQTAALGGDLRGQKAESSHLTSLLLSMAGSIGARCPHGLSDGFTCTSAVQGLPLVLICLNKLCTEKPFLHQFVLPLVSPPHIPPCIACPYGPCKLMQESEPTTSALLATGYFYH